MKVRKKAKRKYTRRKGVGVGLDAISKAAEKALLDRDTPIPTQTPKPLPLSANPLRAQVLQRGVDITLGDRNKSYGDPLDNFEAIVHLKNAFWSSVQKAIWGRHGTMPRQLPYTGRLRTVQNTPFGHAIDMVFNNLGRIASAPSLEAMMEEDRFTDGCTYLAIAYEMIKRTVAEEQDASGKED